MLMSQRNHIFNLAVAPTMFPVACLLSHLLIHTIHTSSIFLFKLPSLCPLSSHSHTLLSPLYHDIFHMLLFAPLPLLNFSVLLHLLQLVLRCAKHEDVVLVGIPITCAGGAAGMFHLFKVGEGFLGMEVNNTTR